MPPLNLNDAEQIREVIVNPVVDALSAKLEAITERQAASTARIASLEADVADLKTVKSNVLLVASGVSLAAGLLWGFVSDWVKQHWFASK